MAKKAMTEKGRQVFEYVKAHQNEDITAADVASALNIDKRSVDGTFTSSIQLKGLGIRVPAERQESDGSHSKIKLLRLTEEGMAFDPDAVVE